MMRRHLISTMTMGLVLAAGVALIAQGTPPGAPGSLAFQVSGGSVWLNWISSPGMTPTFDPNSSFYRLEAGASPGTTFFTWDSSSRGDTPESRKMFYMLSEFATAGVAPGNYYVRVRGVNNGVVGPASNEVLVPITGGCQPPAAPTDLTAITRGTSVFMAWNDGSGGLPASYTVHARYQSGGQVIAALGTGKGVAGLAGGFLNVGGVPTGTYYVQVLAANACGTSPYSNEIVVTAPSNSPARTPDAASGRLPWFDVRGLVAQASADAAGLRGGLVSCPQRAGYPWVTTSNPSTPQEFEILERQKTQRNPYIDAVVARLRQFDTRFGYNSKPTRADYNAIIAGDEIAYHWGSDAPEGSPNVYLIDVLGGHCTFGRETADFRPFFIEYGRFTAAGAF